MGCPDDLGAAMGGLLPKPVTTKETEDLLDGEPQSSLGLGPRFQDLPKIAGFEGTQMWCVQVVVERCGPVDLGAD